MKSFRDQLTAIKKDLSYTSSAESEVASDGAAKKVASEDVGGDRRYKTCTICGAKVNKSRYARHILKKHRAREVLKYSGGKLKLNTSSSTSINKPLTHKAHQVESSSVSDESCLKAQSLKNNSIKKTKKKLLIQPFEQLSVTTSQHDMINLIYMMVMTGQLGLLRELKSFGDIDGLKIAVVRLKVYLKIDDQTMKVGRLSDSQKKHFKKIRQDWSEFNGDGRAIFSLLFDVAFLENRKNLPTPVMSKAPIFPPEVSPLIQNPEIAEYLKRVPVEEEIGKFGVPQDKYRWGFYGASNMDFDTWRKGESSKK